MVKDLLKEKPRLPSGEKVPTLSLGPLEKNARQKGFPPRQPYANGISIAEKCPKEKAHLGDRRIQEAIAPQIKTWAKDHPPQDKRIRGVLWSRSFLPLSFLLRLHE